MFVFTIIQLSKERKTNGQSSAKRPKTDEGYIYLYHLRRAAHIGSHRMYMFWIGFEILSIDFETGYRSAKAIAFWHLTNKLCFYDVPDIVVSLDGSMIITHLRLECL